MCALVTGVQTCALPISRPVARTASRRTVRAATGSEPACERTEPGVSRSRAGAWSLSRRGPSQTFRVEHQPVEVVFDQTEMEEHTSELQSLMRISSAVFCLKQQTHTYNTK